MALKLHRDQYGRDSLVDHTKLWELSRLVSRLTGVRPASNKAIAGENLFVTESGVHQDGLLKDPTSYLPFRPEEVGAPSVRLVLGKHSGRRAVRHRFEQYGVELTDERVMQILDHLKAGARRPCYDTPEELEELLTEVFPEKRPVAAR